MMRDLTDSELLERLKRTGDARRALDFETAAIAQELASRSGSELGQQSLARRLGFRNAVAATSYFGSASHATAKQLIKVGRAGTSRTNLTGELVPPRYERIASAVASADLPVEAAALIVEFLDEVEDRATPENLKLAESTLVDIAPKMTVPELRKAIRNIADMVDPDGAEPSAEERHRKRSLRFVERADGMIELHGVLDAATAAPIKVSVDAIVTTWIRNSRGFNSVEDSVTGTVRNPDGSIADEATAPVGVETRSITQMYADALKLIAEHANGCNEVPESGTKVIVRMQLDSLLAEIDGVSGNISAAEARRLAASAGIIPEVLGGDSEILDLGRTQRLASPAQRLALVERDGGCAFCGLEPSKCEAHHFDWWNRDNGPTDLRNLILLCSACHHRIHAEEWDVRIVPPGQSPLDDNLEGESDARGRSRPGEPRAPLRMAANDEVWFLPPESLLHDRTPRLGGRKRFHPKLTPERSLEV